uniref:Uncharacterized protein n=1 Tax=Oryza punctata TaxID=4537 RepID=A0A0E0KJ28_ORYPU
MADDPDDARSNDVYSDWQRMERHVHGAETEQKGSRCEVVDACVREVRLASSSVSYPSDSHPRRPAPPRRRIQSRDDANAIGVTTGSARATAERARESRVG